MSDTVVLDARTVQLDESRIARVLAGAKSWPIAGPLIFSTLNAIAFFIVRPGVNDLWAARARADASAHGVGLTYWFAWFSGASTPGSYSMLSPYLSRLISVELVVALSAVALTAVSLALVHATAHPVAAGYLAAVATTINLWQGRVAFLLGCAFAAAAVLAARKGRWAICAALAMLSLLSSPVSAAFLGIVLVAALLTGTFARRALLLPLITLAVGAALSIIVFGNPGPDPVTVGLVLGMCALLIAMLLARPPKPVQATLLITVVLAIAIVVIPNGMGSNLARLVWFALPVAVVALTPGRRLYLAGIGAAAVAIGSVGMIFDLRDASQPAASTTYYQPLTAELDHLPDIDDYRLEVVDDGTHTASYAVLDHATLARGFETQTDQLYNATIRDLTVLPADVYRRWLDHNAVGYVAVNRHPPKATAESNLILDDRPSYLSPVWSNDDWAVFALSAPTPIVTLPATLTSIEQAKMTLAIPCTCSVTVRTRWSSLLTARREDQQPTTVTVTSDKDGFAVVTTTQPGSYVLEGR
jgi:hypothetical protein